MTAKVLRLRPKRHDTIAQTLQFALELPLGLSDPTRDELAGALERYKPTSPTWRFTMLSNDQLRIVLKKINSCPHPALTLRVWFAVLTYIHENTGEVMAGRARLAEDAETTPQEVSRALGRLAEMGALLRLRPGRYAINPHVGWNGSLAQRETAAQGVQPLRLIDSP